jgi:uncharacterized protein (DUF362 family)
VKKISRRKLLEYMATGAATIASAPILGACQKALQNSPAETTPTSGNPLSIDPGTTPITSETTSPIDQPPTLVANPDLVVARKGSPEALVQAAMTAIGGMERFVPQGGWVIIKPNICTSYHSYEYATTSNPWVVGALVKMCFLAGANKVQVMDSPFGGSAADAYTVSGIAEQVQINGGEMVQMPDFMFKKITIDNALSLNNVAIYQDVFNADTLINVPIAKNHGLATLTLGMKNLMGLITERQRIHQDFGNRLADLARTIKPTLTVIDAVRILLRNGPTGGDLGDVQVMDTIIVSQDIVAADSYAATLFGFQPNDLEYIRIGNQTGLGRSDLSLLNIRELTLG